MSKIVFFETTPDTKTYVEKHWDEPDTNLFFFEEDIDDLSPESYADADYVSPFVNSFIKGKYLENFTNLKGIATRSTGFDHIDGAAAREKGINVSNVPHYGENTVAEHTFALLLALSRRIPEAVDRTRSLSFSPEGLTGFDIKDKTLGIIGMGRIGSHVARMAKGFDMNVIAYDPFPRQELADEIGFTYVELDDIVRLSDVISLHTAYRPETHHILNSDHLTQFKKGVILLNTARGGLIETSMILEGLKSGVIGGAGLDVLEEECHISEEVELYSKQFQKTCNINTLLQDHMIIHHPRVIVTPHCAFNSREALERIYATTLDNLRAMLKGQPQNIVNPKSE